PPGATAQAHRSTPPLFGFGLVDAIPEATILSHERRHGAKGDGIAGHANRTIDGRVGRFGRKAAVAALLDFNAGAFPQEMGVTTPLSPVEETINGTPVPPDTDPAPHPEITVDDICLGRAHPSEFRTEMLMGLRFRQPFLHDGSAKTVQEAIERHDGEARNSRDRFKALKEKDKQALLKFLETI